MLLLTIGELIGRFHPLLVHLPIGILVIACIFQWLSGKEKFMGLRPAVPTLILWGAISAVFSCITGYLLSQSAEYNPDLISSHQWLGIGSAIIALVIYYLHRNSNSIGKITAGKMNWMTLALFVMITITGHLGGSLTHGEDYLTELMSTGSEKEVPLPPIPKIQDAVLYKDVVNPILEARCYGCHGATKQKGKLRLDSKAGIQKGGEDGDVLVPGKPEESEMIKRLLLSMDAKKHMPPKNKTQLSQAEIDLLHWWVNKGADFSKRVKDIEQPENIKPALLALESGKPMPKRIQVADVPDSLVKPGDSASIAGLRKGGVAVIPVSQNSNYLSVNFISALFVDDSLVKMLAPLKDQLVWVKMDGVEITDTTIAVLAKCKQIRRLQLNNSSITDEQLSRLTTLNNLQSLHLVGTGITSKGLNSISKLPKLKHVFIYKTSFTASDRLALKENFKGITIDTGNYLVPTLPTDTTLVTKPQ